MSPNIFPVHASYLKYKKKKSKKVRKKLELKTSKKYWTSEKIETSQSSS